MLNHAQNKLLCNLIKDFDKYFGLPDYEDEEQLQKFIKEFLNLSTEAHNNALMLSLFGIQRSHVLNVYTSAVVKRFQTKMLTKAMED